MIIIKNTLKVIGPGLNSTDFKLDRWREAILQHTFGVWEGKTFERGPELQFILEEEVPIRRGSFGLQLIDDTYSLVYSVRGPDPHHYPDLDVLVISNHRAQVHEALMRLVKDFSIRGICIEFPNDSYFRLWKGDRRGELYWWGYNLPAGARD